ncbi:MAG: alginate export family protein, partial [Candidatus Omnitrophica bacterium]|nr:alginate export family protein [Candidatus Omnitrophota bacterium]
DPDTNRTADSTSPFGGNVLGWGNTNYIGDLSPDKSFEGVVATYDINPDIKANLTLAYLKPYEGDGDSDDDSDILAIYLSSGILPQTLGELYFVYKETDKQTPAGIFEGGDVGNVGIRLLSQPVENLGLSGEFIYQYGKGETDPASFLLLSPAPMRADGKARSDIAFSVGAQYAIPNVEWSPVIQIGYGACSENWDPMYESVTSGRIMNALFVNTNGSVIVLGLTLKPREDISLGLNYVRAKLWKKIGVYASDYSYLLATLGQLDSDKKHIGDEIDFTLDYDYTEDVKLGLNVDYFKPGKLFTDLNDKGAFQTLASLKVSF